jgi:hypothetical protein
MAQKEKKAKKEYTPPKLREWGTVADLTQAVAGDSQGGSNGGGIPA